MTSRLRKPNDDEANDCVRLIYISSPHIYSYSLVGKDPKPYNLLRLFYKTPGNMYSRDNIVVEEEDGKIRGLILAYPARDMNRLGRNMLKCIREMIKTSGFLAILKMISRMGLNRYFPVIEEDGLVISNLAVFEEYRGRGIAVKLLERAEELAVEKGLNKLSIVVETDNPHAKRIYERFGFEEVEEVALSKKYNEHNLFGFYKMVKKIGGS